MKPYIIFMMTISVALAAAMTAPMAFAQENHAGEKQAEAQLKAYENHTYGFQIWYPDDCLFAEFPPKRIGWYITKFYIGCDKGRGGFDFFISKKDPALTTHETLRAQIMKMTQWRTWPKDRMIAISMGGYPAFRMDYEYRSENPNASSPAVKVWTFNEEYFFNIGCCCSKRKCDQFISRFSFLK